MTRLLVGIASTVVILAGMKIAAGIVAPVLLAWVVAVSMTPLLSWLVRRGVPEKNAQIIAVIVVVVVLLTLTVVVTTSISRMVATIPTYRANLDHLKADTERRAAGIGVDLATVMDLEVLDSENVARLASGITQRVGGAVAGTAITLVVAIFMLLEATAFPRRFQRAIKSESVLARRIARVNHDIRQYMIVMTWSGLMVAVANTILLLLIGVDYAVLWGFLSFLMSYVPTIGFIVSVIPPAFLALLEFGWREALFVVLGYGLIKGIVFSVLKPRYAAQKLDISRVFIIIAVLFFVWLLGPMGSILAVPLAVFIKDLVLDYSDETRSFAILLESGTTAQTQGD
jgi:predicted PurR-regulated permease PerM